LICCLENNNNHTKTGGYSSIVADEQVQALLVHGVGLNEEQCDKVADLICAGESIGPVLNAAKFGEESASGDASTNTRNRTSTSEKGERKMDLLSEDVDREARSLQDSASKRIDIWNGWLVRCDKEGFGEKGKQRKFGWFSNKQKKKVMSFARF
jgi:hypothetical protein